MSVSLHLSGDTEADQLISEDPLALLIGMVLDQQIPLERAFAGPAQLRRRLGRELDANSLAAMDPDDLVAVFIERPALHRFPTANAKRVQALCRLIADDYDGNAAAVWSTAEDGPELLSRIKALPGFGDQKARIFVALLGKQMGVAPPGWKEAAGVFAEDGCRRSVADIIDEASLGQVRAYKAQMKGRPRVAATQA